MRENTRTTIEVSGADAFEFLQGQLTNDLKRLDDNARILSAWCNPKGRVICVLEVAKIDDGFALVLPAELVEEVVKRLTMFRFRAKVVFETHNAGAPTKLSQQLLAGIPYIGREQSEKYTSHMLNLDLLDAISLDKGCYTGQEVIARTHYKGATKRRTIRFESTAPVSVGDKVSEGDRDIGEVLNVSGTDLLAVIPLDKADEPLTANGIALKRQPLPYMIGPDSGSPRA